MRDCCAVKKNRRKKARPLWEDLEQDLLPAAKRGSSLRKQQHSRPDSTFSDEARSASRPVPDVAEAGVLVVGGKGVCCCR